MTTRGGRAMARSSPSSPSGVRIFREIEPDTHRTNRPEPSRELRRPHPNRIEGNHEKGADPPAGWVDPVDFDASTAPAGFSA